MTAHFTLRPKPGAVKWCTMCTNYTPTARDRLKTARLGVAHLPPENWPPETFPGYEAPIVVRGGISGNRGDAPRCMLARLGLVPRWSRDLAQAKAMARRTYNARCEAVDSKPSYRGPWRERHWALVPMENFFQPCWETGRAVRWRITRADGEPFAVAGLWEHWTDPASGEILTSFALLTVNADSNPLMSRMHRPGDEKRMPLMIPSAGYDTWLHATPEEAQAMMRMPPAQELVGEPAPKEAGRTNVAHEPAIASVANLLLF